MLSHLGRIESFAPVLIVSAISRRHFVAFALTCPSVPLRIRRERLHFLYFLQTLRVVLPSVRFQFVVDLGIFERIEATLIEVRMVGIILNLLNHSDRIRKLILLTLSIFCSFHLLRAMVDHLLAHLELLELLF